jgi:hypothetical protein
LQGLTEWYLDGGNTFVLLMIGHRLSLAAARDPARSEARLGPGRPHVVACGLAAARRNPPTGQPSPRQRSRSDAVPGRWDDFFVF